MSKLIKNHWTRRSGEAFERAEILHAATAPEGLDVDRVRFEESGRLYVDAGIGNLITVLRGTAKLLREREKPLQLAAGSHLYVPPDLAVELQAQAGAEMVRVSSPVREQARGKKLLLRDEAFLWACATGGQSLRWMLTPQYLSRRAFLHHDETLLSKAGHPVSWFHTTMFEVEGLPANEDGESVFKMSYNSRTEFNVLYDVTGKARVRMAQHPYKVLGQKWAEWRDLDGDTTYHLDEASGGPEEEKISGGSLRNKHEVFSRGGHVSLMCLFDPAPTGVERHRPGEYSDYEPIEDVVARPEYAVHQREVARFDAMVDRLSIAKAEGGLDALKDTPEWSCFVEGQAAQTALEAAMLRGLAGEDQGRERVIARWTRPVE